MLGMNCERTSIGTHAARQSVARMARGESVSGLGLAGWVGRGQVLGPRGGRGAWAPASCNPLTSLPAGATGAAPLQAGGVVGPHAGRRAADSQARR